MFFVHIASDGVFSNILAPQYVRDGSKCIKFSDFCHAAEQVAWYDCIFDLWYTGCALYLKMRWKVNFQVFGAYLQFSMERRSSYVADMKDSDK